MNNLSLIVEEFACWGCKACEVACKQEYQQLPHGTYDPQYPGAVKYVSVWGDGPKLMNGKLDFLWRVRVCKHCREPICAIACPEGAITKDPVTAIVLHDPEKCSGCQAVKGKSGLEKQETSPCKKDCPAHNNVQGVINLAAQGKFEQALELIKETSPFPSICGRVCPHPCETDCNRSQVDEALNARSIERFLGDRDLQSLRRYRPDIKGSRHKKVAVIGSGPAGLSCAYYLAREGYEVTIFEKALVLGGMLTLAIPAYRLPREIVQAEISLIRELGVTMLTGVEIGKDKTIAQLRAEGFKAFFLAVGTQRCLTLGVEGEDLKGVYGGLEVLSKINRGESLSLGNDVAVIGGGNTALDAVRSARRSGASKAFILYRRDRENMPAHREEIEECLEEGIEIRTLIQPLRFNGEQGRVTSIDAIKMRLTERSQDGRPQPEPIPGTEFTIKVDAVILALGQEADWGCLTPECACTLTSRKTLEVDPLTLQSKDPDIFAGGDAVRGPQTVIQAIADGRQAAQSIDRFLEGQDLTLDRDVLLTAITHSPVGDIDPQPRIPLVRQKPQDRLAHFNEVQEGLTEAMVLQEARRCLSCGSCCIQSCPFEAITFDPQSGKAQKCNLCYQRVTQGLYPACADNICLGHCIYFGDPVEIEKKILEKRRMRGGWGEIIPRVL